MTMNHEDIPMLEDPTGPLERAFIEEFLASHLQGVNIDALDEVARTRLLCQACTYAASRLAEMEAKAHYVDEIHGLRRR